MLALADDGARGRTLLARVTDARDTTQGIDITFQYETAGSPPFSGRLESLGPLRRMEIRSPGANVTALVDGEFVWVYHDGEHLQRMDMQLAADRGVACFDPRLLGITDFPPIQSELHDLVRKNTENAKYMGDTSVDGVNCSLVTFSRGNVTTNYWIDEPSGRVHKMEVTTGRGTVSIHSQFKTSTPSTAAWIPSEVNVVSSDPPSRMSVLSIADQEPDSERFTLRALGIPTGTSVVDYVAKLQIGFWDGENIGSEYPLAALQQGAKWRPFYILSLMALAILVCGAFIGRRAGPIGRDHLDGGAAGGFDVPQPQAAGKGVGATARRRA